MTGQKRTGYPSKDKPWLKYYPDNLVAMKAQREKASYNRIIDKIKSVWNDPEEAIIDYYDTKIKTKDFFDRIYEVAKSLVALGIKKGDSIIASLEAIPEYFELLLASELIGCSIKNLIGETNEVIALICGDKTVSYYIVPDYYSAVELEKIRTATKLKGIITVDPLFSFCKGIELRENIAEVIKQKYQEEPPSGKMYILWENFLEKGRYVDGFEENHDNNIPLFSCFTSGSTGYPKEVIHSSKTVMGIVNQMTLFPIDKEHRDTWLHTITPPSHAAVVISMLCYPLADGKMLILDPYCRIEDTDIEILHFEPTCWGLAPIYFNALLDNNRIPEDYDMSYFKLIGFGAEALTPKYINKVQTFLDVHHCKALFSTSYGQSEGGTGYTTTAGKKMTLSGCYGIPYIDTTISIFEPDTSNELKYYEIGEICKCGPGIMLGYSSKTLTDEVLKTHPDGQLWLHTGDFGYMTEDGLLFVLGRERIEVSPDKFVFPLEIENKIASLAGVKDAIVVSGRNKGDPEFSSPYLFVIPESDISVDVLLAAIRDYSVTELSSEQRLADVFVIDKKPIRKFKVDKLFLQETYGLK